MIRPSEVLELLELKEAGEPHDANEWAARLDTSVTALVRCQVDIGLDWVSDGELSKNSFSNYVTHRLGPFDAVREGGLATPPCRRIVVCHLSHRPCPPLAPGLGPTSWRCENFG